MRISKIRDVKTPTRGTSQSAGIDFYVPNDYEGIIVGPGQTVRIGTGVRVEIPANHALLGFNKSGVAFSGLDMGACVIDEDYQGEINFHFFNPTNENVTIEAGQKLGQWILTPVVYCDIEVVDDAELHTVESERGEGAFGSTGKF